MKRKTSLNIKMNRCEQGNPQGLKYSISDIEDTGCCARKRGKSQEKIVIKAFPEMMRLQKPRLKSVDASSNKYNTMTLSSLLTTRESSDEKRSTGYDNRSNRIYSYSSSTSTTSSDTSSSSNHNGKFPSDPSRLFDQKITGSNPGSNSTNKTVDSLHTRLVKWFKHKRPGNHNEVKPVTPQASSSSSSNSLIYINDDPGTGSLPGSVSWESVPHR